MDDDALDEGARRLQHGGGLVVGDRAFELGDALAVGRGEVGGEDRAGGQRCADLRPQGVALGLEHMQLLLEAGVAQPVGNGVDEVGQAALCRGEFAAGAVEVQVGLTLQALPLGGESFDEALQRVGCHEITAQRRHNLTLQASPADRATVAAGALEGVVAGQVVLAPGGKGAGAAPAEHLVGQEVAGPASVPEPLLRRQHVIRLHHDRFGGEACLDGVPESLVNDAQMWNGNLDEVFGGVVPFDCLSGLRVDERAAAVPNELAGVQDVAQDALATGGASADRCVIP